MLTYEYVEVDGDLLATSESYRALLERVDLSLSEEEERRDL